MDIPKLLLEVPVPEVQEKYIDGNILNLSVEEAEGLAKSYREVVITFLESRYSGVSENLFHAIEFGLRVFNAENFTGELSSKECMELSPLLERFNPVFSIEEQTEKNIGEEVSSWKATDAKCAYLQRLLSSDGEMVSPCVRLPGLLLCLLSMTFAKHTDGSLLLPYRCIWRMRINYRHQLILMHRAHTVFCEIAASIDAILQAYRDSPESVSVSELLEVALSQRYYHRLELAEDTLAKAIDKSGLKLREECLAGVRTRWQQHAVPQLLLHAESSRKGPTHSECEQYEQPLTKSGERDGHDLLDRPRETAQSEAIPCTPLHPEDKAILLMMCDFIQLYDSHHILTTYRMMTYIERLLVDPSLCPYIIRSQILLARARLESRRNRVQERSFLQMTELVDQFSSRRDPSLRTFERTRSEFFYTVAYPTSWELKNEYAGFCFDENLFKTALTIYEETQDWEKIFACCKQLDKRIKAESLARDLIKTDPLNPVLWVALGEATRRDEHLWKAWELAKHKMAAPMRALARLALDRERFDDVIRFFDESVKINPIFGGDWFSLGFACLKTAQWGRSGEAFTRVCQIRPDDAYAWNNLGSILLRERKVRPAFNAISQALKQNRRDWRMWQNYFSIGCELKEVVEATNALRVGLTIAKRSFQFERETLELYVDNVIAYLRGEITGIPSSAHDSGEHKNQDHKNQMSMKDNGNCMTEDFIQHLPLQTVTVDEDLEFTELAPLGVELSAALLNSTPSDRIGERGEEKKENSPLLLTRMRHRCRALFLHILDLFVNDSDIYYCMAKLIEYLDGPLSGYAYKVKELCVCHQKDLWEQDEKLFARTVETLESTFSMLKKAVRIACEAYQNPNSSENVPDPTHVFEKDYIERLEEAASSVSPSVYLEGTPMISTKSNEYQKGLLLALKETQNGINRTIQTSKPHFDNSEKFQSLEVLGENVKKEIQKLKYELDME